MFSQSRNVPLNKPTLNTIEWGGIISVDIDRVNPLRKDTACFFSQQAKNKDWMLEQVQHKIVRYVHAAKGYVIPFPIPCTAKDIMYYIVFYDVEPPNRLAVIQVADKKDYEDLYKEGIVIENK